MQILRKEEKFHKQPVAVLLRNVCSVRHMSGTLFLPLFVPKTLEKPFRSILNNVGNCRPEKLLKIDSSISLFLIEVTLTWKIYRTDIFITVNLHVIFRTDIFQNSYFWLLIEKSITFINENLAADSGRSKLLIGHQVFTSNYFA